MSFGWYRVPALLVLSVASVPAAQPREIHFNRDVRPILSENCYACHGPDKNQRKGKFRLDVRDEALARDVIVPGKPDQSKLVQHIYSTDEDERMPPPKTHKILTPAQKQTLKDWIAAGAEYEPHWAYLKPRRLPVPAVKDQKWVCNPIDAFILAGLEGRGIRPSP